MFEIVERNGIISIIENGTELISAEKSKVLTFGKSVEAVRSSFAKNRTDVEGVILSDSIKDVMYDAFFGCTSLRFVVLGKGLECIWQCGFTNNTALEYVFYNGTADEFSRVLRGEPFEKVEYAHCIDGLAEI